MSVRVLLFGALAERTGRRELSLDADAVADVADVVTAAGCRDEEALLVAVNHELVRDPRARVRDGDEVALMPPFSGG